MGYVSYDVRDSLTNHDFSILSMSCAQQGVKLIIMSTPHAAMWLVLERQVIMSPYGLPLTTLGLGSYTGKRQFMVRFRCHR